MQLQLERQQVNAARQQLERYPRRQTQSQTLREPNTSNCGTTMILNASSVLVQPASNAPSAPSPQSQFLLTGKLMYFYCNFDTELLPTMAPSILRFSS